MKKAFEELTQAIKNGYCLHGSKTIIDVLEPRLAACGSGAFENCQKAVYASQDEVDVAVVMALRDRLPSCTSSRSSYSRHGAGPLVITGTNATFTPGYVHVLPRDTFVVLGNEFISYEAVKPVAIVRVDPSILRLFQNIELHIPIPPPY